MSNGATVCTFSSPIDTRTNDAQPQLTHQQPKETPTCCLWVVVSASVALITFYRPSAPSAHYERRPHRYWKRALIKRNLIINSFIKCAAAKARARIKTSAVESFNVNAVVYNLNLINKNVRFVRWENATITKNCAIKLSAIGNLQRGHFCAVHIELQRFIYSYFDV